MEITTEMVALRGRDGGTLPAFVARPGQPGRYPAVVFGMEAMGLNAFGRKTAEDLARLGYVTITPDYYRGRGPSRPDDYDDFTEVIAAIGELDFVEGTFDILAGVDWARSQADVDPGRVALWGYCTGGTMTLMAAALDRHVSATVIFFLSQPFFEELTSKRPAHARDMIWSIRSPVLLISGADDALLPPELLADLSRRFDAAGIAHTIRVYEGAGHAFTGPARHMHNAPATTDSWRLATNFLREAMPPPA
ncbi:MAG TPA: dienelactone hydrolase family protein [Novosphingobium sp.]|nr:dienelactone hydrolase family protein [Novosphingobium sp.]